jgi:translation elongation factor EF-4
MGDGQKEKTFGKTKKAKARMRHFGSVDILPEAFI